MVSRLVVQGTSADETLILDLAGGALASGLASGTGGVVVDFGGGTDALSIRGSSGVDKMTMGTDGGVVYLDATGDGRADVAVRSAEAFRASLGPGADVFSAMGGAVSAVALGGPKTLAPMTASLEVWGGDGDDTIQGGMGADVLHGGEGADTFLAGATADGDDVIQGGPGVDTMSYAARSAAVTVTLDGVAGDGDVAAGESDDVGTDVEDLVGGKGNDVLVGSPGPNFIRGGDGDDTIAGGAAAGCAGVLDELAGDAGDDTFDLGASAACPAKLTGGAGVDTADFSARTNPVRVTLDGKTNDGEGSGAEGLGVDVERVLGGKGDDVLVGSSGADELHGGPGKDALSGGAGDDVLVGDSGDDVLDGGPGSDTFLEGGTDALYTPAEDRGAGSDVINGGTGTDDLVDYAGRVKALSLTICVDPAALAGKSALGSSACTDADGEQGEGDAIVNVTHLRGGDGDDVLEGGAGDDVLEGGAGKDVIHGGAGNDTLYGDDGDDALFGDDGDDLCDGGPGADAIDAGAGDGDVCATDAADTATACEL
jgi:Ca2+-binding RTX toxin-like protein